MWGFVDFELRGQGVCWVLELEFLALSKSAQNEFSQANFSQANLLLSQAINLKSFGAIHILYLDRYFYTHLIEFKTIWCYLIYYYYYYYSGLVQGYSGALEDAREALNFAPHYLVFLSLSLCVYFD